MKSGAWILVSLCIGAVFSNATTAQSDSHAACDRDCLVGIANDYAAALVGHTPNKLAIAPGVKFTENLVPLKFGEQGVWKTVTGRRDFNIYAADVDTGNVVWIGIVKENDKAVMMAARLKVVGHRITELETLVGRSALTGADKVEAPRPDFAEGVPEPERLDRQRLIAIADSNWDAMEQGNGRLAPYAQDCERYDNGEQTSKGSSPAEGAPDSGGSLDDRSCFGQMNSGRFNNGNKVSPRRIWAVDREHGLAVGLFTPNVPGNVREIKLRGGKMLAADASELLPFTIQQVEMFKIVRGQISKVEVVLGPRVPYGMRSPFDMKTLWEPRP
jgi:hypothetical protein